MKRITLLIVACALMLPTVASADNYGRVSPATKQRVKAQVYKIWGTGWEGQMMVRCISRESGFNTKAANWGDSNGGSFGLAQVNGIHRWRGESLAAFRARMWNPVTHLIAAKRLYDASKASKRYNYNGFYPWGGSC